MATKDAMLKKRLIKTGIASLVIILALAGAGFVLSNFDDDAQSEMQSKQADNDKMRSEHDSIEQDLGTGFEVSSFYQLYIKNHNASFLLNRDAAAQVLSGLREKNHLAGFSLTISPVTDASQDFTHLRNGVATKSEVHLIFSAVSDSSIYTFIESLERDFPGIVAVTDIKFSRTGDLSGPAVQQLSQHRLPSLVNCEMSFDWVGMRPADTAKEPATPAAGGMH